MMAERYAEKMHSQTMVKHRMAQRDEWFVMPLLLIISLAHLLRLLSETELLVGGMQSPLWVSLLGCLGLATLLRLFWWSNR